MSSREEAAKQEIQDAKSIIRGGKYEIAKAKIEVAIYLFRTIKNGRELITLCDITLFKIPSSSTESEVKSRYDTLRDHLVTVRYHQIRGTEDAIKELDLAMSMYKENYPKLDRKRKAPSPHTSEDEDEYTYAAQSPEDGDEDENRATDEENAASDDGGGDSDDDEDDDDVRSPGYKKLRKHIYTALQQKPPF